MNRRQFFTLAAAAAAAATVGAPALIATPKREPWDIPRGLIRRIDPMWDALRDKTPARLDVAFNYPCPEGEGFYQLGVDFHPGGQAEAIRHLRRHVRETMVKHKITAPRWLKLPLHIEGRFI